ncbi:MAG: phosphoribosyltransferase family protein [Candidatus Daviesbacteria bacterium]
MHFKNRVEAGDKLAESLRNYQGQKAVIYALPRGGVVVGAEIAKKLGLPLDLIIVRKIGHPYNPEYAIGAVTENGTIILNEEEKQEIDPEWLKKEVQTQQEEAKRRKDLYLPINHKISANNQIAIIVDDGIATGLTMQAAIKEIRQQNPQRIVIAVPIIPKDTVQKLTSEGIEIIALDELKEFVGAVGAYYDFFPQLSDEEVIELIKKSR